MRAMQSSTASGLEVWAEQFAAEAYSGERSRVNQDNTAKRRRSDSMSGAGVAAIQRKVAGLLRTLDMNAALLEVCHLPVGQSEEVESELRELMERSWRLTEVLVECSEQRNGNHDDSVGEVFLPPLPCRGATAKAPVRIEYVDPVRGATTWQGKVLEEAAAGWIAC
jgi:hypothetical protein